MSFEQPPSLDSGNPEDVARTARMLVQRLADQPTNRSTVKYLSDRYFGSQFTEKIVRIAAEAVVVHQTSPVACDGQELVLEKERSLEDYCSLIDTTGPDDPIDLLEIRETYSDRVDDLELGQMMSSE